MKELKDTIKVVPVILGEYYNAYGIIHSFADEGIESILLTHTKKNFVRYSKYIKTYYMITDVNQNCDGFINDLLEIGKKLHPLRGMLFPTHDEHLLALAKNKGLLNEYFEFPFSEFKTLDLIMNKAKFSGICKGLGIPTIKEILVTNIREAQTAFERLRKPIIVKIPIWDYKAVNAMGNKIEIYYDNIGFEQDMKRFYSKLTDRELLIQEYIEDSRYCMVNINGFTNREGDIQCIFTSEKVRCYPPQTGTSTAMNATDPKDSKYLMMIEYTKKITKHLKYYGLFGIEFKYDPVENTYKVIEMNPRSEFSNYLQTKVGQNMPYHIYKYHTGDKITIPFYPIIKHAGGIVPFNDRFYSVYLNKIKYPEFSMDKKNWKESLLTPQTLYGLTVTDIGPFAIAYIQAFLKGIIAFYRAKKNIPDYVGTLDYILRR